MQATIPQSLKGPGALTADGSTRNSWMEHTKRHGVFEFADQINTITKTCKPLSLEEVDKIKGKVCWEGLACRETEKAKEKENH